jgi:hypothetical protein
VKEEDLILAIARLEIQVSIQNDLINTLIYNANFSFTDIEFSSIGKEAVYKTKAKYPMIADKLN